MAYRLKVDFGREVTKVLHILLNIHHLKPAPTRTADSCFDLRKRRKAWPLPFSILWESSSSPLKIIAETVKKER